MGLSGTKLLIPDDGGWRCSVPAACITHTCSFWDHGEEGNPFVPFFELPSPNQEPNHWKAKGWTLNKTLRNRLPGFCPLASTRRGNGKNPVATALATIPIHSSKPHPQQIPQPNLEDSNIIRKIHYQKRFFFPFCFAVVVGIEI